MAAANYKNGEQKMAKETIKLFEDGEYKTYERDLAKQPLNMEDFMAAAVLEGQQKNYNDKMINANKEVTPKDTENLVKADIKFIVTYFRNQFTYEQAKAGVRPQIINKELNDWFNKASGLLNTEEGKPKK